MSAAKLKDDLSNCIINFDRRVLITELLDNYQCSYEEVTKIVNFYLIEQENKDDIKFEKRYLVYGVEAGEMASKCFRIVEEAKLEEWLAKVKNAESTLYSVEVKGGAKSVAPTFRPMNIVECVKCKSRQSTKTPIVSDAVETSTSSGEKKEDKQDETRKEPKKESPKSTTMTETSMNKTPKLEISSTDKKAVDKKSALKKGINNFFAPSKTPAANKKPVDIIIETRVIKPTTPKKLKDSPNKMKIFFKKQTEQTKINTENIEKPAINTSVQLFDEDEPEEEEDASSDEEENLEALKRDIISADVEIEDANETKQNTSVKRRRILDSDDEEDPPVKQEKLEIEEESKEVEPVAETYLDEEGFVITKKPKQRAVPKSSTKSKTTPPVTMKSAPKETKKSSSSVSKDGKAPTNVTTKTKQAGIMNFFSKK